MKKTFMASLLVMLGLFLTCTAFAMEGSNHEGSDPNHQGDHATQPAQGSMDQFHQETEHLMINLVYHQTHLSSDYKKRRVAAAHISAHNSEIVKLKVEIHQVAEKYGIPEWVCRDYMTGHQQHL